ncbi:MAG: hypothetical protein AAF740_02660 [Bacteroidota bacterium]
MRYFDKILQQLFPKNRPSNLPILEEPLRRNEQDHQSYWKWLNNGTYHTLLQEVRQGYELKQQNIGGSKVEVHILKSPQSNGIAITYPKQLPAIQFQHLFDLLRDRMQKLGYLHYTSGRRVFARQNYEETIDKHYLKPPKPELTCPPFDQHYGNVLIELIWVDRRPSFLRLMAHIYSDSLFQKPLPFDDLAKQLLR